MPAPPHYPDLVSQLYQSPPDQFIAERKRLATELKASGDKENAKRLEKLPRPSLSAWAVNQLWWQARSDFDELFASAARLRAGDLGATRSLRDARERLRVRAGELLHAGSHAVNDTVLRRVGNTLASLAASGSFDPDLPGALTADRDAPGFEATGLSGMLTAAATAPREAPAPSPAPAPPQPKPKQADLEAERTRQEALRREEQRREEQRRAAALAARHELEAELQRARAAVETQLRAVERTRVALGAEEQALERARKAAAELEGKLAALES